MAYLQESYKITSGDEAHSLYLKKDRFDNLEITLEDPMGPISLEIPKEIVPQFAYAINRLAVNRLINP